MKIKSITFTIVILFLAFCLLVSGCSGNNQSSDQGSENEGANTAAKEPEFKWRMQVIFNQGHSDFKQYQQTAEDIYKATNGRLKIEVHPNGTFAGSMEAFQACGDGVFELHSSWPSYIKGIEYAFLPMTTGNMQMEFTDKYVWLNEAGGKKLLQKAFDKVNLKLLSCDVWGTEVLMANQPFKSISDMEGKKMRTSDPRLLAKHGIAGITMPLEEVFTAMATGGVDAAEFGHLKFNEGIGLTDIAKYGIWPDFWNVHFVTTVVVNKDAWNQLPPDMQKIVELAFKARSFEHWTRTQYESALAMKKLKESGKMEFLRMRPDEFAQLRKDMYEIEKEDMEKYGGLTEKAYKSIHRFMEDWYQYKHIARWWGSGLTPEEQAGFSFD